MTEPTTDMGVGYLKKRLEEAESEYTTLEVSLLWQEYLSLPKQFYMSFDEWLTVLLRERQPSKQGWYTDPTNRKLDRWWMGKQWSETYRIKPGFGK